MATTPEGAVKKEVRDLLDAYHARWGTHYFMPVQGGYGPALLDFYGSHMGKFFAIETKAPGKHPTSRQLTIIDNIQKSHGKVFIVDGTESMKPLRAWLNGLID